MEFQLDKMCVMMYNVGNIRQEKDMELSKRAQSIFDRLIRLAKSLAINEDDCEVRYEYKKAEQDIIEYIVGLEQKVDRLQDELIMVKYNTLDGKISDEWKALEDNFDFCVHENYWLRKEADEYKLRAKKAEAEVERMEAESKRRPAVCSVAGLRGFTVNVFINGITSSKENKND